MSYERFINDFDKHVINTWYVFKRSKIVESIKYLESRINMLIPL